MTGISNRQPECSVEYDRHGKRVAKHFADAHQAKRFCLSKHKAGRHPKIIKPNCSGNQTAKVVAAYVRVSTVGQNEAGQKAEIQRWLDGNGINPDSVRWYSDKESGDSLQRKGFEQLQRDVFTGQVATIVCYKLDRISRSLRDGINTLGTWCEKNIRVVSTSQQLDFSGSVGQLLAAVLFAVAQMETETRRERQAAGIAVAKKNGKYQGRKRGTTKVNPSRAQELRGQGLSVPEISRALGVTPNTVFRYLRQSKAG